MKRLLALLKKLLRPPKWVLLSLPPLSFAALILVFSRQSTGAAACFVYTASAYSLAISLAALPAAVRRAKCAVRHSSALQKLAAGRLTGRYLRDPAFRTSLGIYQGMAVNFLYVIFRITAGIRYASVWFISMAVYYLVLGGLRGYLVVCYRRRSPALERRCFRRTARLLFLLNLPMGGMILLMVRTDSGFFYPGHIIYLSALYTFYSMAVSIAGLVRRRRLGSPILSAAKVLNLVAAMMSVLGLQTAMISRFSENAQSFRRSMNAATGGFVYGIVIVLAVSMLLRSRKSEREVAPVEPLGE